MLVGAFKAVVACLKGTNQRIPTDEKMIKKMDVNVVYYIDVSNWNNELTKATELDRVFDKASTEEEEELTKENADGVIREASVEEEK